MLYSHCHGYNFSSFFLSYLQHPFLLFCYFLLTCTHGQNLEGRLMVYVRATHPITLGITQPADKLLRTTLENVCRQFQVLTTENDSKMWENSGCTESPPKQDQTSSTPLLDHRGT